MKYTHDGGYRPQDDVAYLKQLREDERRNEAALDRTTLRLARTRREIEYAEQAIAQGGQP